MRIALSGCLVLMFATFAVADAGIDWNDNPADWPSIKQEKNKVSKGVIDFDDDFWPNVVGFKGPLTSAGEPQLPISPGVVLDNVNIDTVIGSGYTTNLAAFPAFSNWANPSNGIVANYFVDTLEINLTEPNHSMVMINHWSIADPGQTVDVSFFDKQGALIDVVRGIASPEAGHPVLYWTKDRSVSISRIEIFDPVGNTAEGIMQTEFWIPEPASLSLLALGGLALIRRRRR